jgi:NDP-sugar pyrophosphorylase family protein
MLPLLILAGGKGTRLSTVSNNLPKYLMPISDSKCFADIHLSWCRDQGFKKIFLSVGVYSEKIQNYVGNGNNWNLDIEFLYDGDTPLGTGGAVLKSLEKPFEDLAVTYGDTILELNVSQLMTAYKASNAQALMTVFRNTVAGHICNADWQNGFVSYDKINPNPKWQYIDYGFMVFSRKWLQQIDIKPPFDLATPLSQASKNNQLAGYLATKPFWEIGTPNALETFKQKFAF